MFKPQGLWDVMFHRSHISEALAVAAISFALRTIPNLLLLLLLSGCL
jgi:hypothetical protein